MFLRASKSGGGTGVPNTAVGQFITQASASDTPATVTGLGFTPRIVSVALDDGYSRYYKRINGTDYCEDNTGRYFLTETGITITSDGFTFAPQISSVYEFGKEATWFASA